MISIFLRISSVTVLITDGQAAALWPRPRSGQLYVSFKLVYLVDKLLELLTPQLVRKALGASPQRCTTGRILGDPREPQRQGGTPSAFRWETLSYFSGHPVRQCQLRDPGPLRWGWLGRPNCRTNSRGVCHISPYVNFPSTRGQ